MEPILRVALAATATAGVFQVHVGTLGGGGGCGTWCVLTGCVRSAVAGGDFFPSGNNCSRCGSVKGKLSGLLEGRVMRTINTCFFFFHAELVEMVYCSAPEFSPKKVGGMRLVITRPFAEN